MGQPDQEDGTAGYSQNSDDSNSERRDIDQSGAFQATMEVFRKWGIDDLSDADEAKIRENYFMPQWNIYATSNKLAPEQSQEFMRSIFSSLNSN